MVMTWKVEKNNIAVEDLHDTDFFLDKAVGIISPLISHWASPLAS